MCLLVSGRSKSRQLHSQNISITWPLLSTRVLSQNAKPLLVLSQNPAGLLTVHLALLLCMAPIINLKHDSISLSCSTLSHSFLAHSESGPIFSPWAAEPIRFGLWASFQTSLLHPLFFILSALHIMNVSLHHGNSHLHSWGLGPTASLFLEECSYRHVCGIPPHFIQVCIQISPY